MRECLAAEEELGQFAKASLDLAGRRFAAKERGAGSVDFELNPPIARLGFVRAHVAQRARPGLDLRLRQVEEVLPLDFAGTHVVADGVSRDPTARVDDQGEFRLRHVPFGVTSYANTAAVSDDLLRHGFEEQLRTDGLLNSVVSRSAKLRLFHARLFAAEISDTGGPDLLPFHRAQDRHLRTGVPWGSVSASFDSPQFLERAFRLEQFLDRPNLGAQIEDELIREEPDADTLIGYLETTESHESLLGGDLPPRLAVVVTPCAWRGAALARNDKTASQSFTR